MSEVKRATDEFLNFHFGPASGSHIGNGWPHDYECIEPECAGWTCHTVAALVARIESDRAEIADLKKRYNFVLRDRRIYDDVPALLKLAEADAEIARLKAEVERLRNDAERGMVCNGSATCECNFHADQRGGRAR